MLKNCQNSIHMTFLNIISEIDEDEPFYLEMDPVLKDYVSLGISLKVDKPFLQGRPDITHTQYAVLAHKPKALQFLLDLSAKEDINMEFDDIIRPKTANEKGTLFDLALKSRKEKGEDSSKPEAGTECLKVLIKFALDQLNQKKIDSIPPAWFNDIVKPENNDILKIWKEFKIDLFPIGDNNKVDADTLDNFFNAIKDIENYQNQLKTYYGEELPNLLKRIQALEVNDKPIYDYINAKRHDFKFLLRQELITAEQKQRPTTPNEKNPQDLRQTPNSPEQPDQDDPRCAYTDQDGNRCPENYSEKCSTCGKWFCPDHLPDHGC